MHNKDVVEDLRDRLALLRSRHSVVFESGAVPVVNYVEMAEALKVGLMAENSRSVTVVRGVVDPRDQDDPSFWVTPLGRLLFAAGGYFGAEVVPQSLAAGLLGCSRQWVHELIAKGALPADARRNPLTSQVRVMVKAKIDKEVK